MAEIYCCCDVASPVACAMCSFSEVRNPVRCFRTPWPLITEYEIDAPGLDSVARDIMLNLEDDPGVEVIDKKDYWPEDDNPGEPGPGGKAQ